MSYYTSYVMDHVIGLDMVKEVNNYMSHPFTESRKFLDLKQDNNS